MVGSKEAIVKVIDIRMNGKMEFYAM